MADLLGLCVPYELPAHIPQGRVTEVFGRGAFRAAVSDGRVVMLINHEKATVLAQQSDGTLQLSEGEPGVYATLHLRDRTRATELRALVEAGQVRGWSISFAADTCESQRSSDGTQVRHTRVGRLISVSLCVSVRPAYQTTWAAVDSPQAHQRVRREVVEAIERRMGNNYVPGLSDRVESTTAYQGGLAQRWIRGERERPQGRSMLLRYRFSDCVV